MAHAELAFHKKGVFSGASSVRSDGSAMGNWSRRQPLIIVIFGWGGCTATGYGVGLDMGLMPKPPKNDDGDKSNADEAERHCRRHEMLKPS